ncbi:MAG: hypothetical protein DHS20C11_11100 [Lysobacteraceae bacterium]|nr:MAG: hypothetical protein DHS20C11_11100 [Xanthomonadaceae bacterium]
MQGSPPGARDNTQERADLSIGVFARIHRVWYPVERIDTISYMFLRLLLLLLSIWVVLPVSGAAIWEMSSEGVFELSLGDDVLYRTSAHAVSDIRTAGTETAKVLLWKESDGRSEPKHYYAHLTETGRVRGRVRHTSYHVELIDRRFDPLDGGVPPVAARLQAVPGQRLHLVQLWATLIPQWRQRLKQLGVEIHGYIPEHTLIVDVPVQARSILADLDFVRWLQPLHPEYRIEPALRPALLQSFPVATPERYAILVAGGGDLVQSQVARQIEAMGGSAIRSSPESIRMEAMMTPQQLEKLARNDLVLWIERWGGPPQPDVNLARIVSGADYLQSTAGYTGAGVIGAVFDGNFRLTHQEFATNAPIVQGLLSGDTDHGTKVLGTIFAEGVDPTYRGVLSDGQSVVLSYNETFHTDALHTALLNTHNAVFVSRSFGGGLTLHYSSASANLDRTVLMNPLLVVTSQSNDGSQQSRPEAWAKNVVSVGGAYHFNNTDNSDDQWGTAGASHGPAADGRVKPDLTHFYDSVRTTNDGSDTSYTFTFNGTSAATPLTAGHFGLFFQMWHDGVWAGFGGAASVFASRPGVATTKAMLIHHAFQYDWTIGGNNATLDRSKQGWGRADVQNLYDGADDVVVLIDESEVLGALERWQAAIPVGVGASYLKATMSYLDYYGTTNASQHRINDLSLRLVSPSGVEWWGNRGLDGGLWSTSGGSSNKKDTVENIFIEDPEPGGWVLEVWADEVVADTHLATPEIDAVFGLVASTDVLGGFVMLPDQTDFEMCVPDNVAISLDLTGANGFADPVTIVPQNLPTGASNESLSPNPATPPELVAFSVDFGAGMAYGDYDFQLQATSGVYQQTVPVSVMVVSDLPQTVELVEPGDGAEVGPGVTVSWLPTIETEQYLLEVDDDPAFGSPLHSIETANTSRYIDGLVAGTTYYWRVTSQNLCGDTVSQVRTLSAQAVDFVHCSAPGLPFDEVTPVADTINIPSGDTIRGVEVALDISHTYVWDIEATLSHADTATSSRILFQDCPAEDVDAVFSDRSNASAICISSNTPAMAGFLPPDEPLTVFRDESSHGDWTLSVVDHYAPDDGVLNEWCIRFYDLHQLPIASSQAATAVEETDATLNALVNPQGSDTQGRFEWGTTDAYGNIVALGSVGAGSIEQPVSAGLSGLSCDTQYHYRIVADNPGGTAYGADQTFTTVACGAPEAVTNTASSVNQFAATLNGTVSPHGLDTSAMFEWGETAGYGQFVNLGSLGDGPNGQSVGYGLTGLSCQRQYHYRVTAENAMGSVNGHNQAFTTSDCTPPDAITDPADALQQFSATLHGTVNPNGDATSAVFEWGLSDSYGDTEDLGAIGSGMSEVPVMVGLSNLTCGTQYHFRITANNSGGTSNGLDETFTTVLCSPPGVTTDPADGIGQFSATLNGTVNPNGDMSNAQFEWGETDSYGQTEDVGAVGSDFTDHHALVDLTGLSCGTEYHFRITASNSGGTSNGQDLSFQTLDCSAPTVTTLAATDITAVDARLHGEVDANGDETQVWFDWGSDTAYGQSQALTSIGGFGTQAVDLLIEGLDCESTYHYRLRAENSGGVSFGDDETLTTSAVTGPADRIYADGFGDLVCY